jgi:hypothetical protein
VPFGGRCARPPKGPYTRLPASWQRKQATKADAVSEAVRATGHRPPATGYRLPIWECSSTPRDPDVKTWCAGVRMQLSAFRPERPRLGTPQQLLPQPKQRKERTL